MKIEPVEIAFEKALSTADEALAQITIWTGAPIELKNLRKVVVQWGLYRYSMGTASGLQYVPNRTPEILALITRMDKIHDRGLEVDRLLGQFVNSLQLKYTRDLG